MTAPRCGRSPTCSESGEAASLTAGAATAATECPDPMPGGPRRFSWARGDLLTWGSDGI